MHARALQGCKAHRGGVVGVGVRAVLLQARAVVGARRRLLRPEAAQVRKVAPVPQLRLLKAARAGLQLSTTLAVPGVFTP